MAYVKTSVGAYLDGGSFIGNDTEEIGGETRYYCTVTVYIEINWGSEVERLSQSQQARLKDPDDLAKDYKLVQWTVPDMARALAQAMLDADTLAKTNYGTGDPSHGTATTDIV